MNTMKIAVTGASGHIGFSICKELISSGYEVRALVRAHNPLLSALAVVQIKGDITETTALEELMDGCDVTIHAAGMIHLGSRYNQKMYDINVSGTKNVICAAQKTGVKRFIHFSSVHAYSQKPHDLPVDETRHFIGERAIFYDQTKRDAHLLVLNAASEHLEVIVLCPTSVIGPPDYKISKLGQAVIDICKGKVPAVIRGGFDFVDVRDIAIATVNALTLGRSGESYILGNEYLTIKEFANLILSTNGSSKQLRELPLFMGYAGLPFVKSYAAITKRPALYDKAYIDILRDGNIKIISEKAKQELGYTPRPIRETLIETVQWLKEYGKI